MRIDFEMPRFCLDRLGREIETGVDLIQVEFEPDFSLGSYDYDFVAVYVWGAPKGGTDTWHEIPRGSYAAKTALKYAKEQCSEAIEEALAEYRSEIASTNGDFKARTLRGA